jgi:hypothetical protein
VKTFTAIIAFTQLNDNVKGQTADNDSFDGKYFDNERLPYTFCASFPFFIHSLSPYILDLSIQVPYDSRHLSSIALSEFDHSNEHHYNNLSSLNIPLKQLVIPSEVIIKISGGLAAGRSKPYEISSRNDPTKQLLPSDVDLISYIPKIIYNAHIQRQCGGCDETVTNNDIAIDDNDGNIRSKRAKLNKYTFESCQTAYDYIRRLENEIKAINDYKLLHSNKSKRSVTIPLFSSEMLFGSAEHRRLMINISRVAVKSKIVQKDVNRPIKSSQNNSFVQYLTSHISHARSSSVRLCEEPDKVTSSLLDVDSIVINSSVGLSIILHYILTSQCEECLNRSYFDNSNNSRSKYSSLIWATSDFNEGDIYSLPPSLQRLYSTIAARLRAFKLVRSSSNAPQQDLKQSNIEDSRELASNLSEIFKLFRSLRLDR